MRILLALCLVPLAGCTIAQSKTVDEMGPSACRNEPLAQFTGQSASEELGRRMLAASGAKIIRWVPQGGVVTMDFSPHRLTVQLDGSNRVEHASCG